MPAEKRGLDRHPAQFPRAMKRSRKREAVAPGRNDVGDQEVDRPARPEQRLGFVRTRCGLYSVAGIPENSCGVGPHAVVIVDKEDSSTSHCSYSVRSKISGRGSNPNARSDATFWEGTPAASRRWTVERPTLN